MGGSRDHGLTSTSGLGRLVGSRPAGLVGSRGRNARLGEGAGAVGDGQRGGLGDGVGDVANGDDRRLLQVKSWSAMRWEEKGRQNALRCTMTYRAVGGESGGDDRGVDGGLVTGGSSASGQGRGGGEDLRNLHFDGGSLSRREDEEKEGDEVEVERRLQKRKWMKLGCIKRELVVYNNNW